MAKNDLNTKDMVHDLKKNVSGDVRFDDGYRALYATDASNYRQVPIGVVLPRSREDVIETVRIARQYNAPILSRGGGTSLAGQCCNTAVIMDFSKYMRNIKELNEKERYARIEPGIVLDVLRNAAEKYHLTYGPDPATHDHCTLGGMMGNNSCGVHSVMAGKTVDNVHELDILLYDGTQMTVGETSEQEFQRIIKEGGRKAQIYSKLMEIRNSCADKIREKYPHIPRRVSGYNLDSLLPEKNFHVAQALIGSESTCVVILEAKVKLVESPPGRSLLVIGYNDLYNAGYHVPEVLQYKPIGLEGMDDLLIRFMERKNLETKHRELLPKGNAWLLVEFGAEDKKGSDAEAKKLIEKIKNEDIVIAYKLFDNPDEEEAIWKVREAGLGATAHIPGYPSSGPGWEDSAVPPDKVGDYLKDLDGLFHKYGYEVSLYGHFGQGCIHCRIPFEFQTEEAIKKFRSFLDEASDLVLRYGGSLSGEHGDGQARGPLLYKMFGKELIGAFNEFKNAWDPDWKMNPGKVVQSYKITENLRIGTSYDPIIVDTYFAYHNDKNNFSQVSLRCVGVGECRKINQDTMCPSYMVTREEMDSTRGRARLLHEMMRGEVIKDGWKSKAVKESLDLCLACKGCKGECPVNVDMATYKAEFLAHYYEGSIRPAPAYAMGLIYWWARAASHMPGLANFFMQTAPFKQVIQKLGGISPERKMPPFADVTFRKWYDKNKSNSTQASKKRIILWADTFNNFFLPRTAVAAYKYLTELGYDVVIPKKTLCCGRPLYDFGFLKLAKKLLSEILDNLKDEIQNGTPVVGLEPSCITVFRDELLGLFSRDENAKRLSQQVFTLSDFLLREGVEVPEFAKKALVHGHCHHKSILDFSDNKKILQKMKIDCDIPETGCCGMAGSFGFEADKYDVSVKCGDRVLLPKVREADQSTLIIADGFSCREQIEQLTDRQALHLAEVLYAASHNLSFTNDKEIFDNLNKMMR